MVLDSNLSDFKTFMGSFSSKGYQANGADEMTFDFTTGKQSGGTKASTDVVWPTKP